MKVALTVPESSSVTVTSSTASVGSGSLSVIVPSPWPSPMVAFVAFERFTKKVSLTSSSRSELTVTETCFVASPAANVSGPPAGSKSAGEPAVPAAVAQSTETARPETGARVTVKTALTVPESPSVTVTSLTDRTGGASSSRIVPRPMPSAIVALLGSDRVTVKVSSSSSSVSLFTRMVSCLVVTPALKTRLPPPPT